MDNSEIQAKLLNLRDAAYRDFNSKLIPGKENIIGIRMPKLKELAKEIAKSDYLSEYLKAPGKKYYEEVQLHGLVLGYCKIDIADLINYLEAFVPLIDNWAVCDTVTMNLKQAKKNLPLFHKFLLRQAETSEPWTIRFVTIALMCYYLGDEYIESTLELFKKFDTTASSHYYVMMGLAWALCTSLIKQYEKTLPLIEGKAFSPAVNNKAIQKCVESYRFTNEQKEYLRSLKINFS